MFAHNLESNRRQTDDDAPHAPREGRLRFRRAFLTACAGLLCSGPVQAALHDRGGGLVYDDVLDVTWLQDANYARTSGYDADGKMSWVQAQLWAETLNYYDSVRGVTYSDWRLPQTFDLGAPGCDYGYSGTDCGYNLSIASSELAHLYYADFGNRAFTDSRGLQQPGYGLVDDPANPGDESLFRNLQSYGYWSGTPYYGSGGSPENHAWHFNTNVGSQNYTSKGTQYHAWAVRNGDVAAVPEPHAYGLFLAGLGLVGFAVSRRRAPGRRI